jgi:hypothetical protein
VRTEPRSCGDASVGRFDYVLENLVACLPQQSDLVVDNAILA